MSRKQSLITLANEQVDILLVCRWVGVYVPDEVMGRSVRTHCPFEAVYHLDYGDSAAFRIYPDSNSAYCFAACGYFTPVWLAATAWNQGTQDAAAELLSRIGYEPEPISKLWAKAQNRELPPDLTYLSLALKTYCERVDSDWESHQFDVGVSTTLDRCFALLDRVFTSEEAKTWLSGCKVIMQRVLGGQDESSS